MEVVEFYRSKGQSDFLPRNKEEAKELEEELELD